MVDSNDSFFREINEEINRERMENIWKRYGVLLLGAGGLIVATVAGVQVWSSMAKRAAENSGVAYQAGLDALVESKADEAKNTFDQLAKSGPAGYSALAQLQLAGSYLDEKKPEEALKIFERLSKRTGADRLLVDFATLQAAALRLGEADFTEMQNRLNGLIKDDNSWRFSAHELLGIAAQKAGKLEEARQSFGQIVADSDASPSLRQRAELRLAQISALPAPGETAAKAEPKPEPAAAEQPGADGSGAGEKTPQPAVGQ